jgi:hypothetical protein
MKIKKKGIYSFKLNSGEELIAKVVAVNDDDTVELTQPLSIGMGQTGAVLMPSMISGDPTQRVTLNLTVCSLTTTPTEQVIESYNQGTSDISLPAEKKIIMG